MVNPCQTRPSWQKIRSPFFAIRIQSGYVSGKNDKLYTILYYTCLPSFGYSLAIVLEAKLRAGGRLTSSSSEDSTSFAAFRSRLHQRGQNWWGCLAFLNWSQNLPPNFQEVQFTTPCSSVDLPNQPPTQLMRFFAISSAPFTGATAGSSVRNPPRLGRTALGRRHCGRSSHRSLDREQDVGSLWPGTVLSNHWGGGVHPWTRLRRVPKGIPTTHPSATCEQVFF